MSDNDNSNSRKNIFSILKKNLKADTVKAITKIKIIKDKNYLVKKPPMGGFIIFQTVKDDSRLSESRLPGLAGPDA
jgi:hypothetical protein